MKLILEGWRKFLSEAPHVEETINEQEGFSPPHEDVVSLMRKRFKDDTISFFASERDPREVTIQVPTSDRFDAAAEIKQFLQTNFGEEYSVANVRSRGNIIGAGLKRGSRVVVKYILKPTTAALVRNRGDVAEGLLGAAVAQAFISGGNPITVAEVEDLLEQLDQKENELPGTSSTSKVLTKPIKREDGTVDTITCVIRLRKKNFDDLMDTSKRNALTGLLNAAVAYSNSEEMLEATTAVATNGVDNKVATVSDGVSKQRGTKIDIKVFLDGKATSIGRISLKAGGTSQLGQVGGSWDGIAGLFRVMFGIEIDERLKEGWERAMVPLDRTAKRVQDEAKKIYEDADSKINRLLNPPGDDVEAEVDLIRTIAAGMNYQVALKEQGVILIHLDAGEFKVLDFALLEDVLREKDVDLASVLRGGLLNPVIEIVDKKANNRPLFQVRFKQEGDGRVIRNYVEKRPYMVELLAEARKQSRIKSA